MERFLFLSLLFLNFHVLCLQEWKKVWTFGFNFQLVKGEADFYELFGSPIFKTCHLTKNCHFVIRNNETRDFKALGMEEGHKPIEEAQNVWRKMEKKEKISLHLARTYQSSDPTNSYKAIDGIKCNDYQDCTCTHTSSDALPPHWWAVEFPQPSMVKAVSIVNRGDCCSTRLRDFNIRVGFLLENGANPFCRRNVGILTGKEVMFDCDELVLGKYLFIESNVPDDLTICELEVFGELFF